MKNRNKRITSVLAASMALGTFAPVIASVAPVFAFEGVKVPDGNFTANDGIFTYDVVASTEYGVQSRTAKITGYYNNYEAESLNIGPTTVVTINGAEVTVDITAVNGSLGNNTLKSVTVTGGEDGITLGTNVFMNSENLATVSLANVTTIGQGAFAIWNETNTLNASLTNVTFSNPDKDLTTIGKQAFLNQGALTSIDLPEGLTTINQGAFAGTGLTGTVKLPSSLTTVEGNAFATSADSLTLEWPIVDGKDSATLKMPDLVFAKDASTRNFIIAGSSDAYPDGLGAANKDYWKKAPNITIIPEGVNEDDTKANKDWTVESGIQLVQIKTEGTGTLYIDGVAKATYNKGGTHTYDYVTPQTGEHAIKFVSSTTGYERTLTLTVKVNGQNYWVEKEFTVPEWHLGADVTPSGAEAKFGSVYYVYSNSKNGVYTTATPNTTGTWWVKAVVDPKAGVYTGLETPAQSFEVLAALPETGWVQKDGNWYYLNEDGEAVKNELITVDGRKYLLDENGVMQYGWQKNDLTGDEWMFFDNYGCQKTGWLSNNGKWYFFNEDGIMQANEWVTDKGKSYFLTQSGGMAASRWLKKDGHDVYVDNSGALKTGWLFDSNYMAWYYLEPDTGYMATSGTVDGWTIQANGQAVQK